MPAALLSLVATAIGFVLGLVLLRVLGEKAWHHGIALSVGVFFVVFFALLLESTQLAFVGTAAVTALILLFWYAGFWQALIITILATCSYVTFFVFGAYAPPAPP
jgi:hypothetical protein